MNSQNKSYIFDNERNINEFNGHHEKKSKN